VTNFTHFDDKLVFSLNNGKTRFMSKRREYTPQAHEIIAFPVFISRAAPSPNGVMLHRAIIAFVALLITACGYHPGGTTGQTSADRILRRGLPGEPRTLDPQLADDDFSFEVVRDLYEGLTSESASGQVIPGAAASWTLDPTGTVYTFHLRPQAKWSNGDRTTASEFVRGLRRAVDPRTASGSAGLLAVIKGATDIIAGKKNVTELAVTAIDESTVQISLEHPAPFILQVLSQPIGAPFHTDKNVRSNTPNGPFNGAYVLVNRVTGSYIDLADNPEYWNSSKVSIKKVRYVNTESEATELRKYIAGEIDLTFSIPLPDLDRISKTLRGEIHISPTLGTTYLALNLSKPPLKDNLAIRQALSIALDREQIAKNVMGGVMPAYSLVANGTTGYDPPKYDWVGWTRDRQLAYAKLLYAQSGYSTDNPLHLRLYFSNGESIQRVMIAVAGSWRQNLGVISELTNDEFRVFLVGRKDRSRWDVERMKWDADYDDPSSFLDIFTNGNNQNDPDYGSAGFNNLIMQARMEPEPTRRMALLHGAEQVLMNDYPIIPIYFTQGRRLVKPFVGGAELNPMNRIYSKNLFWK
jgi:ABC-type oligopeptide transport system substrate-binding subunit